MQPLVVTHTSVGAVVAPTQRHDAIGNTPNPILADRVQPPASLQPNRRLPVRDQSFSGDNMPTPVSPDALRYVLVGYNRNIVEYLINGFQHGFRIGCFGLPAQDKRVTNLKSAVEFPAVIDNKITKELALSRILGPFDAPPPSDNFRISPLGVVPKKTPGEFRMIHHLSYPEGSSVNDFIPKEISAVQYATIQDAIRLIKQLPSSQVFMAKVDIESAFRIIPVSPMDRPLLGFQWKGKFFMDAVLPMGVSSACAIFELFSIALEWIAKSKLGATAIVHVIGDFLFIAHSRAKCGQDVQAFVNLCVELGVPLAPGKTVAPTRVITFLGITLDTVLMESRLPEDKLEKAKTLLEDFQRQQKVTLKVLQSLIGILNFACTVIVPGRAFLRRIIDMTLGVQKPHHHIRLTRQAKLDLQVWHEFLLLFNGMFFFLDDNFLTGDHLHLYTDVSASIGFGALYGMHGSMGSGQYHGAHITHQF